jgi:hypothetical protein
VEDDVLEPDTALRPAVANANQVTNEKRA